VNIIETIIQAGTGPSGKIIGGYSISGRFWYFDDIRNANLQGTTFVINGQVIGSHMYDNMNSQGLFNSLSSRPAPF
jgi:hypothetical protein